MKELEDFSLEFVTDYIINEIATERKIDKKVAKKLFINALSYNVVIAEINNQVDFLLEN